MYIGQWCLSPLQSRHLGTSHSSPNGQQLPCSIFLESHWQFKFSLLSKVILVLGKARSHRAPNLGCREVESPGWFDVLLKNSAWYVAWTGALSWWSCQSTVTNSFSLLNHLNNFHREMFKLNAKFDADSLLYSVTLNVIATQYTCSLNGIYCPHSLVKLSLLTHMHSSSLSLAARINRCLTTVLATIFCHV